MKRLLIVLLLSSGALHAQEQETSSETPTARSGQWEVTAYGGWAFRTAKLSDQVPSDFRDYAKKLKSGYTLGTGLGYFWSRIMGVGIRYSYFGSRGTLDNVWMENEATGERLYGNMSDNMRVQFFGATWQLRYTFPKWKPSIYVNYGLGYLQYDNNATLVSHAMVISGGTGGVLMDLGLDIPLGRRASITIGTNLVAGTLQKLRIRENGRETTVDLEEDERENLSRIDLSAGLRWRF